MTLGQVLSDIKGNKPVRVYVSTSLTGETYFAVCEGKKALLVNYLDEMLIDSEVTEIEKHENHKLINRVDLFVDFRHWEKEEE